MPLLNVLGTLVRQLTPRLQSAVVLLAMSLVGCAGHGARGVTPSDAEAPRTLRYDGARPIPPGYHLETHDKKGLAVGGAVLLGVSYGLAAAVAVSCESSSGGHCQHISSRQDGARVLFAPIVGPLVAALGPGEYRSGGNGVGPGSIWPFLLVLDSSAQTAGVVLVVLGLTLKPKQVLVRDDVATTKFRLAPLTVGYGAMGLGLVGDW